MVRGEEEREEKRRTEGEHLSYAGDHLEGSGRRYEWRGEEKEEKKEKELTPGRCLLDG